MKLIPVIVMLLCACAKPGEDAPPPAADVSLFARFKASDVSHSAFMPSGGVYVQVLDSGTGRKVTDALTVTIVYTGYMPDGSVFDSNASASGRPLEFVQGFHQLVPGLEEGVRGMREGARRRILIPSDLAYGSMGAPPLIPPDTPLLFDVTVSSVADPQDAPVLRSRR